MAEISNTQNLNAHYSTNAKVQRPARPVDYAPNSLPKPHLFNDTDANNRMKAINQDIYIDSKKEENRAGFNFIKIFGAFVLAILAIKLGQNIFKKS